MSSSRTIININDSWEFTKDNYNPSTETSPDIKWEPVQLPHTWNAKDVTDDEPGYYRGVAWYRKKIAIHSSNKNKQVYLRFEAANQIATVFVNGKEAGTHTGGYTAFQFPISPLLKFDDQQNSNEIVVKVDNSFNEQVPPLTADFTFFGGVYRDVWLVSVSPVHFSLNNHGSNGIFISTPHVNEQKASIHIWGSLVNENDTSKQVNISTLIFDKEGKQVNAVRSTVMLKPGSETNFRQQIPSFSKPHLWQPDDPYLYTAKTIITEAPGKIVDEVINSLGFRWFRFDAAEGFFLNGKSLKLVGASRHQDRPGLGNAVPDQLAREDVEWLKKMGGNFLRVAHYPQDPVVLETCDRLGILASVEIPVVNEITESESFYTNCQQMQVEMIRQNFNHPSVIIWCYMNEVLLRPHFNNDKPKQKKYFNNITSLAKRLDSITRVEDQFRYTMIAHHGDFDKYKNAELTDIPMIVGWNLYSGWYGGELENFPAFLDRHRKELPSKPIVVAEYGADADPRIRSEQPVRFDKSVEYTTRFHQYYLQEMMKRPFVAGAFIWNLADFNSETREETMPHINNKGLLRADRTPKDPYYFYQAMLTNIPLIKILSADWNLRSGIADSASQTCYQSLQVASNLDSVELFLNGSSLGWQKPKTGLCEWRIPFVDGNNIIRVKGIKDEAIFEDTVNISFILQPYLLTGAGSFKELNILLGANRYFKDTAGNIWQPDQPYRSGSWGHVGGRAFKLPNNNRLPYGSDKNIFGTNNDPIYQTQQTGISNYCFDVGKGEYELTLHFAELESDSKDLPYNLSPPSPPRSTPERRFNVYVNNTLVLENFDIAAQYGRTRAISKRIKLSVEHNEGIQIFFEPIVGEPVLNAIQVKAVAN